MPTTNDKHEVPGGLSAVEVDSRVDEALQKMKRLMGMEESEDDIIQQCGGLRIRVYEAGEFPSKNNPGTMESYDAGISLASGNLKIIVESSDLAMLKHYMTINHELNASLNKRLKDEQDLLKELKI